MAITTYLLKAVVLHPVDCFCLFIAFSYTCSSHWRRMTSYKASSWFLYFLPFQKENVKISVQQVQILYSFSLMCKIPVCTYNIWLMMYKLSCIDQELKGSTVSSILISLLHLVNALGKQIIQSIKILCFKSLERSLHVLFWAQKLLLGTLIKLFY